MCKLASLTPVSSLGIYATRTHEQANSQPLNRIILQRVVPPFPIYDNDNFWFSTRSVYRGTRILEYFSESSVEIRIILFVSQMLMTNVASLKFA